MAGGDFGDPAGWDCSRMRSGAPRRGREGRVGVSSESLGGSISLDRRGGAAMTPRSAHFGDYLCLRIGVFLQSEPRAHRWDDQRGQGNSQRPAGGRLGRSRRSPSTATVSRSAKLRNSSNRRRAAIRTLAARLPFEGGSRGAPWGRGAIALGPRFGPTERPAASFSGPALLQARRRPRARAAREFRSIQGA